MLNDFYALAVALETSSAGSSRTHNYIVSAAKSDVLKISVGLNGKVKAISIVGQESDEDSKTEHAALKKYMPNKHKSFPIFNVPVFRIAENPAIKAFTKSPATLLDAYSDLPVNDSVERAFEMMLRAGDDLLALAGKSPTFAAALPKLVERLHSVDIPEFASQVEAKLLDQIKRGNPLAVSFLICNGKQITKSQWCCELDGWDKYPVNSPEVFDWINERLLATSVTASDIDNRVVDAYGHECGPEEFAKPFPQMRFEGASPRAIWTSNPDNPSKTRYVSGSLMFPVSENTRISLSNAISWLMAPKQEGIAWRTVPGCDKKTVMLGIARTKNNRVRLPDHDGFVNVFLTSKEVPATATQAQSPTNEELLSDDLDQPAVPLDSFIKGEELAVGVRRVLDLLDGDTNAKDSDPVSQIMLVVMESYSKAQTLVVLDEQLSRSALEASAEAWDKGCNNILPVSLNLPVTRAHARTGPSMLRPKRPKPVDMLRLLNKSCHRFGEECSDLKRVTLTDIMQLFLHDNLTTRSFASVCLSNCLASYGSTWLNMSRHTHQWKQFPHPVFDMLYLPTTIGLLLTKMGWKGNYMEDAAFNLGLLLKHHDRLHVMYCKARGNDIPNGLMGAELVQLVCNNPDFGFKTLMQRAKPYMGWASKFREEADDSKEERQKNPGKVQSSWVGSTISRMEKAIDRIIKAGIPKRLATEQIARLYLGYGSSLKADENTSAT